MTTSEYKTMTTAEIREQFLRFFESKGCKLYPSSSLIPDDPSLLLANAGMNQFKEYYQGTKTMREIGATSCQKCLRTNDIENIGDARHLSFFEMLGNFSFGGYTKGDAIAWAYEFITSPQYLGLPKDRLYMTVYEDDDEAIELWHDQGIAYDHISRLGEEDNFWAAGPTGPCGPCSEIYFDQGPEFDGEKPGDDGDRYLEFWNLVFTQYDRQEDGSMPDLPHRNIDTGMGLERIAAIMQHKGSNYEGDVLRSLIGVGEKLACVVYQQDPAVDKSLRILADHSRAVSFMIGDGILPSNEGRGYVLRRLLRRAVYHGRLLGITDKFLTTYFHEVKRLLGDVYTALVDNQALIDGIITAEEQRFSATLDAGEKNLQAELAKLSVKQTLPGDVAFKLHDTYGFPIDLTCEIALEAGHEVDMDTFKQKMEEQRELARKTAHHDAWGKANNIWVALSDELERCVFEGYEHNVINDAHVMALVVNGERVDSAGAGTELELVLDRTPFYAEKGGQIGDTGKIVGPAFCMDVIDTKNRGDGLIAHIGVVCEGTVGVGTQVEARIDLGRRELIRRNHTATHLLDATLIKVLGDHVSQAGSLVAPDRLRFDFTHFEALTPDQIARIEGMVNAEIIAAHKVVTKIMSYNEAKNTGAIALFGEKYEDVVRVVSTDEADVPFSRELCGGTHVRNTSEIGLFKIISESSIGSNTRRIEAVTSAGAVEYVDERLEELGEIAAALKCQPSEITTRIAMLQQEVHSAHQRIGALMSGAASDVVGTVLSQAIDTGAYRCAVAKLEGISAKELRNVWDGIRNSAGQAPIACVLASATPEGTVALLAAATDDCVKAGFAAGDIVRAVAQKVDGRGGGRPNMAQAGGKNVAGIDDALALARDMLTK